MNASLRGCIPAALFVAVSTSCAEQEGRYRLLVHWDPASLVDDSDQIDVSIVIACEQQGTNGEAPVGVLHLQQAKKGEQGPRFTNVAVGTFGVYARAYSGCRVNAAGCSTHEFRRGGSGDISVTLSQASASLCPSGS